MSAGALCSFLFAKAVAGPFVQVFSPSVFDQLG